MSVRNLLRSLSGKTAIVTGGSRGIGLQMATALGEMGAKVALTARKQDELDEARAELERAGIECHTIAGDLANFDAIPGVVSVGAFALGTDRHPGQQRRLQLGRAGRGLSRTTAGAR